ncbi:MAG TPA: hypothetical protein VIW45_17625 [Vicinamibacterales bacterium]|jgi:hypothetical protein
MLRRSTIVLWTLIVIWITSAPARAQGAPLRPSVTAGYQLLHIPDETFPLGFNIDVGVPINGGWSGVAEAGFAHDNVNLTGSTATSINFTNFGGGARWTGATSANAAPFVQLLVGGVHTSANVSTVTATAHASDTAFMIQPGIGVVVPATGMFAAVVQADYRRVFFSEEAENEFRLFVGIRLAAR